MDINSAFDIGGVQVPNPDYNPKSKKNKQPRFITVNDLEHMEDGSTNALAGISYSTMGQGLQGQIGELDDYKKYLEYGIVPRRTDTTADLDKQLIEAQGAMSKIGNSIAQTVVSELGLGTVKAISDVFGLMYQSIFDHDHDYSNPVSEGLEQLQEQFRAYAPIYSDQEKNIANGGLLDVGWWASNAPSIISSLTLLIPGGMVTKGAGLAAKGLQLNHLTRGAVKAASKSLAKATGNAKIYRNLNKASTVAAGNRFLENGLTAVTMRAAENYQEACQTYNDAYKNNLEVLNNMNDEDYTAIVEKNAKLLADKKVDVNNRDEVAKTFAKASADVTFAVDWFNVGWDLLELYSLKNMWSSIKNAPSSSAAIRKEERLARRYFNKTDEEIAKLEAARPKSQKIKEWAGDKLYGSKLAIAAQLSEGAEEALNYIAQEEGMTFGKALLSADNDTTDYGVWANTLSGFDGRLGQYLQAPQLWDSAFWGVLGGVVFQAGGSYFARVKQKFERNNDVKDAANDKTPWYRLDQLPETKRRIAEIRSRRDTYNEYKEKLARIRNNEDIYKSTKDNTVNFVSEVEQEAAVKRLTDEFIAKLTLNASYNGNLDMLKAWLADENVRKGMIESGIFASKDGTKTTSQIESEATSFIQDALNTIEKVENMYDDELMAINDHTVELNKNAPWGAAAPIEYLQIIAANNVTARLAIEGINVDIANINGRIGELVTKLTDDGKLDPSVDYRSVIRSSVLLQELSTLRIQRRQLVKNKDRGLTTQIAIQDIDRKIEALESKLTQEELLFVTYNSIRAHYSPDGKLLYQGNKELDTEAILYEDALITGVSNQEAGTVLPFKVLEHLGLSERARTSISEGSVGAYKKLLQDAQTTFTSLKSINEELDGLYTRVAAQEFSADYLRAGIVNTSEEVERELANLHNSMDEARRKAINQAGRSIRSIYFKHADDVRNYIKQKYGLANNTVFNRHSITDAELATLDDALDVLDLTKTYNKSLLESLDREFALYDQLIAAGISEEDLENIANENQSQPQQQPNPNNPTQQPTQQPTQPQNSPQPNPATDPTVFVRQQGKIRIVPDINGGFTIDKNVKDNEVGFNYYVNGNGEIKLELPTNGFVPADIASIPSMYAGYDRSKDVKTDVDYDKTTHPTLTPGQDGKYQVKEQGEIVYKQATTSSTGVGVASSSTTAPVATPAPAAEEKQGNDEGLEYKMATSTQIQMDACAELFRASADESVNLDEVAKNIVDRLVQQGHDKSAVEPIIEKSLALIKRKVEQRKNKTRNKQSTVDEVIIQSSLTEYTSNAPLAQAYKDAVSALVDQFAKDKGITNRNGKIYLNLEALLRYANSLRHDAATANMIYESMRQYLTSDEANAKYVLTDENIGSSEFLNNVNKTEQQRVAEQLETFNSSHRIDITSIPNELENEEEKQKFYDAIDKLEVGEKISAHKVGGRIVLNDSKGNVIGSLAIPSINQNDGTLHGNTDGWAYDFVIHANSNDIDSKLKNLFVSWLSEETDDAKTLNNIIYEIAYGNVDAKRKTELVKQFSEHSEIVKAKKDGLIDDKQSDERRLDGLAKLWRYVNNTSQISSLVSNIQIESSVHAWFKKAYESYTNALKLARHPEEFQIDIAQVVEGELIKATEAQNDMASWLPASKALAGGVDTSRHKIAIGSTNTSKTYITSDLGHIQASTATESGLSIIMQTRRGTPTFISADIARFNSPFISQDAKDMIQAAQDEVFNRIKAYVESPSNETFEDVYKFLSQMLSNTNGNSSIFFGLNVNFNAKNGIISINTGRNSGKFITLYQYNGNHTANSIMVGDPSYETNENGQKTKTIKLANEKEVKDAIKLLFDNARFNVRPEYIQSDNNKNIALRGIATRSEGKFVIKIGDKTWTYDSFNEFILKNNLVRLNTKPSEDGKSNFRRRSIKGQRNNQNVRINVRSITSPVGNEQSTQSAKSATPQTTVQKSVREKVIDVLNSNLADKGSAIFNALIGTNPQFTKEWLKAIQKLKLLPKNIIFDEKFNKRKGYDAVNAEIDSVTGKVTVGTKWLDMISSPIDASQAIRKLIHEQLHYHLHDHKGYIRNAKTIYDEFKRALDNNIPELANHNVDHLRAYLFEGIENSEEALEEFLVESLTSEELARALNAIPAEVKRKGGKRNLFQKFLEFMADMFGWNITKNSLYEQELYTLREGIEKARKAKETTSKQTKENPLQQTLNFDEEQVEELVAQEEIPQSSEVTQEVKLEPQPAPEPSKRSARSLRDKFKNLKRSSVTESTREAVENTNTTELVSNVSSTTALSERLPLSLQPNFDSLVQRGVIESSCR